MSQRLQQQDGWVHSQVLGEGGGPAPQQALPSRATPAFLSCGPPCLVPQNPFFFRGGVSSVRESSLDSRALNPAGDRVLSTVVAVAGPGTGLACGTAATHTVCVGCGSLSATP